MADNEQNLDTLLERSSVTDVPVLLRAKEAAKRRLNDDPSPENFVTLARAMQMLGAAKADMDKDQKLASVKDVLAYLRGQARKISQSQLYKDLKRGHLRREADGSFTYRAVDRYAQTLALVAMPEAKATELEGLAEQEMREKIGKTREQRLSINFDRKVKEAKYILREGVALELASRAAALGVGLRSVFRLHAPDYIRMVGGDVSKADDLAAEFEQNLDAALNEYSRPMDFKVEYVPENSSGEAADSASQLEEGADEEGNSGQ